MNGSDAQRTQERPELWRAAELKGTASEACATMMARMAMLETTGSRERGGEGVRRGGVSGENVDDGILGHVVSLLAAFLGSQRSNTRRRRCRRRRGRANIAARHQILSILGSWRVRWRSRSSRLPELNALI